MKVRKQTILEWFTDYQLQKLGRRHFHLPISCRVDISSLNSHYQARSLKTPLTALVVKAAALTAQQHPEINRIVQRGWFGTRVLQFSAVHVNLPLLLDYQGRKILAATVIREAAELSVAQIEERIQKARQQSPLDLPIARRMATQSNNFFTRMILRLFYQAAHSFPYLYGRYGGGISVSSVLRPGTEGVETNSTAYGPTAFTISPGLVLHRDDGKTELFIGIGYDHCALGGYEAARCVDTFTKILRDAHPGLLQS